MCRKAAYLDLVLSVGIRKRDRRNRAVSNPHRSISTLVEVISTLRRDHFRTAAEGCIRHSPRRMLGFAILRCRDEGRNSCFNTDCDFRPQDPVEDRRSDIALASVMRELKILQMIP